MFLFRQRDDNSADAYGTIAPILDKSTGLAPDDRHLKVLEDLSGRALRNETAAQALLRRAAPEREAWQDAVTNDPLLPARMLPSDYQTVSLRNLRGCECCL